MNDKHISTFLNLVLLHKPHHFNVQLDANGWADVHELITIINKHDVPLTIKLLEEIVATNNKQSFTLNTDHSRIRGPHRQFISIKPPTVNPEPPPLLYHGTIKIFLSAIQNSGLNKMNRKYVHLCAEEKKAYKVGARKGEPVVLIIDAAIMQADGFLFYLSNKGVWLTEHVPVEYISLSNY